MADEPTPEPAPTGPAPGGPTVRRVALAVGVVIVALVGLFAFGGNDEGLSAPSDLLGTRVPAVAGPTLDGSTYDIDLSRGRWVAVNFFATWCVGCVNEHPELVDFDQWGHETGRAEVVAVVFNDEPDDVREFFATYGGSWPVLDNPSLAVEFQVSQVPETFLIAPSGQVVQHVTGEVRAEALIATIESFDDQP